MRSSALGKLADMQTTPRTPTAMDSSDDSRPEVERQLAAAADRHREVVASMQELGRPESGQHVAVKAVGRAVHLVSFALRHAADSGVPVQRLVELTRWDPQLVNVALARGPEPSVVARLAPAGLDPGAVAQAAASVAEITGLHTLARRVLADVGDDALTPAADLAVLHDRLEGEWQAWRREIEGRPSA
jgi:hypothetical protein